jgi:microcystin-dependent protein
MRISIQDFSLANPIYALATVSFYSAVNGVKTTTKATLYAGQSGTETLTNPQRLDSDGKLKAPVYIDEPVIAAVSGLSITDHDTGVIGVRGSWKGDWTTGTVYQADDQVRDPATKNIYIAATAHTAGTLAADIASGKLVLEINVSDVELAKTAAQTAAINAATSEENALSSKGSAETAAGTATTQAGLANTAMVAAEAARDAVLTAYDNFDDRYLGAKASDPTLDNDGNALVAGALYFNTVVPEMRVYTGVLWVSAYVSGTGFLAAASNLSDVPNKATARSNLELGTAAQADSTAFIAAVTPGTSGNLLTSNGTSWTSQTPAAPAGVPTGAGMDFHGATAPSGWILADGRTIGDASSGATNRANTDVQTLYAQFWNDYANTELAVTGGRGASAAADWGAHKVIAVPDMRGRVAAGKDNMGGTAANRLTSGGSGVVGTTLGKSGGAETTTLTTAQLASHAHGTGFGGADSSGGGGNPGCLAASGTDAAGSGAAHQNTQPTLVCNYIIKL